MKLLKAFSILSLAMLMVFTASAQNMESVNPQLNPKTAEFALEVYGQYVEYQTPEFLSVFSKQIDRVSVENIGNGASAFPSLSTVGLKDKYNPSLTLDKEGFDPLNFNPLKYHFEFYNAEVQKFRIGSTGYIVIISSFQQ